MNNKRIHIGLIIALLVLMSNTGTNKKFNSRVKLSAVEIEIAHEINKLRKRRGLKTIPLSSSLSYVGKTHVKDLQKYYKISYHNKCNMHSWSKHGKWTPCCYTKDHKKAKCIWRKPKELTKYTSTGYEIAFYTSGNITAKQAVKSWMKSHGHKIVMLNKGMFKKTHWNAMGVGVSKNYAVVWFGEGIDKAPKPIY